MPEFRSVGKGEEIGEGQAMAFDVDGQLIAVARSGGELFAFSDICTHRQCNLSSGGDIDGTAIECECHGSRFDMKTGEVLDGPAVDPIEVFEVREDGEDLQVGV